MKKLTSDQTKIDLIAKLVKDGAIDFIEAIKLLEVEVEKEYINIPYYYDWTKPFIVQQPQIYPPWSILSDTGTTISLIAEN